MWRLEPSPLGRILVPPDIPDGFGVLFTTQDYPGFLGAGELTALVSDRFGLDTSLTTCVQVHSATVVAATRGNGWRECDACDALWSAEKKVSLGIKVADCLPVAIIEAEHGVIANVHSGWRGAAQGIVAATLDALEGSTAFEPSQARAWLGPSIRVCCFEVGEEVAAQFDERFVDRSRSTPHLDLVALTVSLLRDRGFAAGQISDSGACTRCPESLFHSYRREGPGKGRNLMVVAQ